ncbi:MAG TPA: tetratricopeptide repeat protein [Chitinophagales bacterium]|nr:tetratricopeptide repeat protein [Chitinophagales bacterium]
MKFFSLILFLILSGFVGAQSTQVSTLIAEAKSLDASAREEESLQKFLQVLHLDPGNYEATWNASFLYARIGNRLKDTEKKKQYFITAKQYADKALLLNPNDAESNYVMAVAMGRIALISPTKEKVAASREIKKYAGLAIQFNPNHAGAWYVLGKWNYEVANLNWAEKAAANLLFGGIPEGSLDEAIRDYLKAIKFNPDYILYYYDLAKALEQKEYYDEEIRVLNQALTLKPKTEDDPSILIKCKELLDEVKK